MAFPTASPPCFSNLHHHTGRYSMKPPFLCGVAFALETPHGQVAMTLSAVVLYLNSPSLLAVGLLLRAM